MKNQNKRFLGEIVSFFRYFLHKNLLLTNFSTQKNMEQLKLIKMAADFIKDCS